MFAVTGTRLRKLELLCDIHREHTNSNSIYVDTCRAPWWLETMCTVLAEDYVFTSCDIARPTPEVFLLGELALNSLRVIACIDK